MKTLLKVTDSATHASSRRKRLRQNETLSDFAENSTTHGIFYVFERDVHYWSRLVWLLTVLALFILAIVMIKSLYGHWRDNPITTTIEDPAVPIEEIEFPAITLCGIGTVTELATIAYIKQIREFLAAKGEDLSAFDEETTDTKQYEEAFGDVIEEMYGDLGREPYFLAELLSTQRPNEFLKVQVLKGLKPLCTAESITQKCLAPAVYDKNSDLCYMDGRETAIARDANDHCRAQLMETFIPVSDEQLSNLALLIKKGKCSSYIFLVTVHKTLALTLPIYALKC